MSIWSARLSIELSRLASDNASTERVSAYRSRGKNSPVTLFPLSADGATHGNFFSPSFAAIVANSNWTKRLTKSHAQRVTALPAPYCDTAKELDSCTSSDALLMNIFCYPRILTGAVAQLLKVEELEPEFGVDGEVPLRDKRAPGGERPDATEIDMRIGQTHFEAKLTESDFKTQPAASVERYADLERIFDREALQRTNTAYASYQLLRNVLAIARRPTARFLVLVDGRRPDLLHEWWTVHAAIRERSLRERCGFVLWQELAAASPAPLRRFLERKYGL